MNNQEKPNIQVVCEPRNWGSLSTLYRVNNEKSIPYYHTAVEYKAHMPHWWSYVQTWWPTVGDLGYGWNYILECLTQRMRVGDQTSICLSNLDKQIMPPAPDAGLWWPGQQRYGQQRIFRDGDVHAEAAGVIGDALKAYVEALKGAGSESKLFLTLYFNIPAPMAKRVLDHFELGDLNIVESCQIFSEEIKELAEKCKLPWPQRDLDSWQEMTCGNRWISETVLPAASRFGWSLNRAIPLALESDGLLDESLLHEVWVDMRNRPHLREFYHKLKLSNEPVVIHPESIGDKDWRGLSFLWGNHLIQHVGNNEFINPCPLLKKWINPLVLC